ncbi:BTB/POZ domain-containing protein 6-like isoform X2 [Stegodyphus dumicola]|nr:BTB/POZ domain-containing protein 6-like isoform X2 [Stegodyphus dumicola]
MSQLLSNAAYGGAGERLFLNEDLSDITILVKGSDHKQWRFPVHSLLLSSQSLVFWRMLSSDFSEKTSRQVIIEDIKPKTVELLLGYIYCGRVHLENWNCAIELLRASHKYQVDPLVQYCGRFLESVVTVCNVCYIYNEACMYALMSLKEKCLRLILDAGFVVLRSKAFEMLSKDSVMDIVTNPCLNIGSELMVFEALLRWAPMQCCRMGNQVTEANILHELEPFLKYVCFDDMSDTEKSALPAAVLSCVEPNNRNRLPLCVPDTLMAYTYCLGFQIDQEYTELIADSLCCVRFSFDTSLYIIGIKFVVAVSEFPHHFPLTLVKESATASSNMFTINLASASWKEGLHLNDRKRYEALIRLRQPCHLEAKTVYKMYSVDRTQNAQCPKTQLLSRTVLTEWGRVNISLHSQSIWGITGFHFICDTGSVSK